MKERHNKGGNLVKQSAILAIAAFLVKFIGFVYKIPLRAIITPEGYSLYYKGFAVYGVILVVTAYGVPMALSKMLSEKNTLGQYAEAEQVLKITAIFTTVLSVIGFLIMFFGADIIAVYGLKTPESATVLKALSPTLLLMPFLCVLRGYFQGHNSMAPTAVSQILEQLGNAGIGLVLAFILVNQSLVHGAAGATFGTFAGALLAVLFLLFLFTKYRVKEKRYKGHMKKSTLSNFQVLKNILMVLVPITVVAAITSVINLIDASMYPIAMSSLGVDKGITENAFGLYSSTFVLLTNFPIGIATALAAATIPSIASSMVKKEFKSAENKMSKMFKLVTVVALPASVGLAVLAGPISQTVLRISGDNLAIVKAFFVQGSCIVYFFSIFQITNAVLQGMHKVKEPVKNMLAAGAVKIIANIFFLFFTDAGVYGLIYSSIVFSILLTILNIRSIYRYSDVRFNFVHLLLKPIIASAVMGVAAILSYKLIFTVIGIVDISCILAIGVAGIMYFISLLLVKGISRQELEMMPMGAKIADKLNIK